ncbi:hypothetical protein RIF29_26861 [Crotalaria pallida]|uniref:Uncharacterized protein n=1 Tax=Crotalaria pallida TaxID=3830 RepID=A0AAN9EQJ0_CROPI
MCPPPDKVTTKGAHTKKNHAKMKFEKSTKREPSEWEFEDSSSPFPSAHSSKSKGSQTRKKRVAQTPLKQESKKSCSNKYLLMFHPDFRSTKFAPKDKWLDLPFFGSLIATKYQIILVNVGMYLGSMFTYLPLWGSPIRTHTIVALGFVSDDHWIMVNLVKDSPLPPVYHEWMQFRQEETNDWKSPFFDQFARFKMMLPPTNSSYVDLGDN